MKLYDVDVAAERRRQLWQTAYLTVLGALANKDPIPVVAARAKLFASTAVAAWDEWNESERERQAERAPPSPEDQDSGAPEPADDSHGDYLGGGD